jgi:hypothetical protein
LQPERFDDALDQTGCFRVFDKVVDVGQPSGSPLRHDSRERDIGEAIIAGRRVDFPPFSSGLEIGDDAPRTQKEALTNSPGPKRCAVFLNEMKIDNLTIASVRGN